MTSSATSPARTHPSGGRHKQTTSNFSTTAVQDKRPKITSGRGISEERVEISDTDGKDRSSTVGAAERKDTGSERFRIGVQAERTDSEE